MQFFDDIGLSKFVAIDLETTGLDPNKDKIIEYFSSGNKQESFIGVENEKFLFDKNFVYFHFL